MPTLEAVARSWWAKVPPEVRRWRVLEAPKRATVRALRRTSSPPAANGSGAVPAPEPVGAPKVVRTLDELDEMLTMLEAAGKVSDDELRRGFTRFRMDLRLDLPADPYSPEYGEKIFELYEWLHGTTYTPANEVSSFDISAAVERPFPYSTGSPRTVGDQLIAIGHIIRTMDLAVPSRVLELGAGWGNTTLQLAQLGHDVSAIDIEANFVKLMEARAERAHLRVRVLEGDFSLIDSLDEQFDAVLFFECFHHAADHLGLLAGLDRIVAPGGKVLFAAEPITDSLPYPWCLRLDGESLWAIRQNGWFELGFQETYFRQSLARFGWRCDKVVCSDTPWGVIFVATRAAEPPG